MPTINDGYGILFPNSLAHGSETRIPGNVYDVVTDLVKGRTHSLLCTTKLSESGCKWN